MINPSIFPDNITCAYSTRKYGELAPFRERGDGLANKLGELTAKNREEFLRASDLVIDQLVELKQFHTDKVITVSAKDAGSGFVDEADAMITREVGVALSVFTSDCLPVFLYDPVMKVIAVAHAGWRGVYSQIISKTIIKMAADYEVDPANILAWIAPSVSGASYCFDMSHFDDSPANEYFKSKGGVSYKEDVFCVNLREVATRQLIGSGVVSAREGLSLLIKKQAERLMMRWRLLNQF